MTTSFFFLCIFRGYTHQLEPVLINGSDFSLFSVGYIDPPPCVQYSKHRRHKNPMGREHAKVADSLSENYEIYNEDINYHNGPTGTLEIMHFKASSLLDSLLQELGIARFS